jgi:pimeloyl-ACP methyl ester carboxylesterase
VQVLSIFSIRSHFMPNWTEGDVLANSINLHYYRTGGDKPPVLMIHGITDNGQCWTPLARALEGEYDVIMVDARGHGRSDVPAAGYTNAEHAADAAALIQALGLEKPALIGHSMGAAISAFLAAHYPDLVSCIILEDPPWWLRPETQPESDRIARAEQWRADVIQRKQQTREEILASGRTQQPAWSEEELALWATSKVQVSPNVIDYVRDPSPDWTEFVPKVQCPALLIAADVERGAIISPATAQQVLTLNPNFRVANIAGAGHSIRRERFEPYVQAVRTFLYEVYV